MPQQFMTLDEAAAKLGLTPSEFKWRLRNDWKDEGIRPFQDGATLRFKVDDVDKLSRLLGKGSDPELQLDPDSTSDSDLEDDLELSLDLDLEEPVASKTSSAPKDEEADDPLFLGDDGEQFTLAIDDDEPASVKKKEDSDSDVRIEKGGPKASGEAEATSTDEIDFRLPEPTGSGSLKPNTSPPTGGPDPDDEDDSSEFELSLEDSDSDFQLELADDDDEEIDLGSMPTKRAGDSGINLGNPADSGISLESKSGELSADDDDSDEEIDFELSLDVSSSGRMSSSRVSTSSKNLSRPKDDEDEEDDSSEFELSLDDSSGPEETIALDSFSEDDDDDASNDIFETDFDIPALDDESASEAIELDEADTDLDDGSEIDIALDDDDDMVELEDESASEVMLLDEDEDDGDLSVSAALRGVSHDEDDEEDYEPVAAGAEAPTKPWGVLPALMLLPCALVLFIAGIMGYELLHGMWGYQAPGETTSPVVDKLAETFDMQPTKKK